MFDIPDYPDAVHKDQSFFNSTDIRIGFGGFNGNGIVSGCAVTPQGSPNMTVHVAAGTIYWNGGAVAVSAGNVTIPSSTSSPRRDLIVVSSAGALSAVGGTAVPVNIDDPSVVPVLPALPANSLALAAVDVPANATTITAGEIIDKRIDSLGSTLTATSSPAEYFRQAGTSPWTRYYLAGGPMQIATAATSDLEGNGVLHAVPYVSGRGGTIDRLAIYQATQQAGQNMRLGIYKATSSTNLYPDALILDSGNIDMTGTGIKEWSGTQVLLADTLYWFVHFHGGTTNTPKWYYAIGADSTPSPIFGQGSGTDFYAASPRAIKVAQTFGALPVTFPASATFTVNHYMIGVRYSA